MAAEDRGPYPLARPFETETVLSRAIAFAESVARVVGARRVVAVPASLPRVVGDPVAMEQAILLVLLAAYRSAPGCPLEVTVTASVAVDEGQPVFRIIVADDRPAPPIGVMPNLRRPGESHGLDVSRDVVQDHGGRMEVSAGPSGGYRVTITLPVATGDTELPDA
jgi:signal transduction histidine kinase